MMRMISLGAGVQSTTMALMAAHGEIGPMPDCAIFADTGWEPKAVYEHLAWLRSPNVLPFPERPARQQWMTNRHPLLEKTMTRKDCLAWLDQRGYPRPPKSSCIGCPFHNNAHWRDMRDNAPEEWADAVAVDRAIRLGDARGLRSLEFMHSDRIPLDEVDLRTDAEAGQPDLFNNECEGMCGV